MNVTTKASKIKLLLLDVDGVLTDGTIYFSDVGESHKTFNVHDGFGIKMLMSTGVEIGLITARHSAILEKRAQELEIQHVYQNQKNKLQALEKLMEKLNLSLEQIAYVGDDLLDLPVIRRVGLGIAVADASEYVCEHAAWKTKACGGRGAVREVCELIMQAQGTLSPFREQYL